MASPFSPSTGRLVLIDPPTAYGRKAPLLMLAPPGAKLPPGRRVHPVTALLVHGFTPLTVERERMARQALAAAAAGYGEGAGFGVALPAGRAALTMAGLGVAVPAGGGAGQRAGSVVARAADDLAGLDGDQEPLPEAVLEVMRSWKTFEENLRVIACLRADQLAAFDKSASKGIALLDDVLLAPKKDWSAIDLRILKEAGYKLRVAAAQSRSGYLPASSIVKAAATLNFFYDIVLLQPNLGIARVKFPSETAKVLIRLEHLPSTVPDPDAYFEDMVVGMSNLVDTIDEVFRRAVKAFWSMG